MKPAQTISELRLSNMRELYRQMEDRLHICAPSDTGRIAAIKSNLVELSSGIAGQEIIVEQEKQRGLK